MASRQSRKYQAQAAVLLYLVRRKCNAMKPDAQYMKSAGLFTISSPCLTRFRVRERIGKSLSRKQETRAPVFSTQKNTEKNTKHLLARSRSFSHSKDWIALRQITDSTRSC
jgi:hypothetical protein